MSSALEAQDVNANAIRRKSRGTIEIQDDHGRRKTVQLEELSEADRALAEKFGYKPVCLSQAVVHATLRGVHVLKHCLTFP
jgi:hypothetical protein